MQLPLVIQWPQEAALAQAALRRGDTVVLCIHQPRGADRPAARASARLALRTALGGWLNCPTASVVLQSAPGAPVQLQFPSTSAVRPGLSISHEQGLSLAAIAPQGPVGVDLLATTALPDADECLRLARDYLDSHTTQALAALPPAQRTMAFAQAWTSREAGLKCMGQGLNEWSPENEATWPQPRQHSLTLPQGYLGSVAHLHTQ